MPQPGEVWLASIAFTSGVASKLRPVLILWLDGQDAVVAAITSANPRSNTDVPLSDWSGEGLRVPSTVRLSRLDCPRAVYFPATSWGPLAGGFSHSAERVEHGNSPELLILCAESNAVTIV
jgi:hypothetical protein